MNMRPYVVYHIGFYFTLHLKCIFPWSSTDNNTHSIFVVGIPTTIDSFEN